MTDHQSDCDVLYSEPKFESVILRAIRTVMYVHIEHWNSIRFRCRQNVTFRTQN